jgi:hypothetical protein
MDEMGNVEYAPVVVGVEEVVDLKSCVPSPGPDSDDDTGDT